MLEEIIKEYKQENYLYFICSKKELDFLEKISQKKIKKENYPKYKWEIHELNKKAIFSEKILHFCEHIL